MNQCAKWAEYRRIRDALFSVCWDCPRPCADCREWARSTAFGRVPKTGFADGCAHAYAAAMKMELTGCGIMIDLSQGWKQER